LREAGLALAPHEVTVERREERWAVSLPADRIAWFPASAQGHRRLATERRVLRLLADRCSFAVPRVLYQSPSGYDVRAIVPGSSEPWGLFAQIKTDAALARAIGRAVGQILVEQHTRIARPDVAGWLPACPAWPEPSSWIREQLPHVVDDSALVATIENALAAYARVAVEPADQVLVHADLGLHNLAIDPISKDVRGVFDYDGAAWADRHHDFRYLVLLFDDEALFEAARAVYEPAVGRALSVARVWLYNAVCAISFLASRRGVPPGARPCGRTLDEDLAWVRGALARLDRINR